MNMADMITKKGLGFLGGDEMAEFGFVICSQNKELQENTRLWIAKHFPDDTEVYFYENSESIFKAYNEGIEATKNCKICIFCHEDLDLESINLKTIRKKLKDPKTGFLGVAGAKVLDASGCWWQRYEGKAHPNLSGQSGHQKMDTTICSFEGGELRRWTNFYGTIGPVQVLDGVFLICRRDLLDNIRWDEEHFEKSFDFYDISITYEAHLKGYKNYTISGIEIYHWGLGVMRESWEENRKKFIEWSLKGWWDK